MNYNKTSNTKLVYGGAKYKNPSCPSIQKNSYSIDYDYDGNDNDSKKNSLKNKQQKKNKYEKYDQEQDSYEEDLSALNENSKKYSALDDSNNSLNINIPIKVIGATDVANSNVTLSSQNSKIDTLRGFTTVTLFTTKFDIDITYITFLKNHPHDKHGILRIAFKEDQNDEEVTKLFLEACKECVKYFNFSDEKIERIL